MKVIPLCPRTCGIVTTLTDYGPWVVLCGLRILKCDLRFYKIKSGLQFLKWPPSIALTSNPPQCAAGMPFKILQRRSTAISSRPLSLSHPQGYEGEGRQDLEDGREEAIAPIEDEGRGEEGGETDQKEDGYDVEVRVANEDGEDGE